ncbi:MAG: HAD family hydrolase [Microbacteriaceae bacterium]|nr:MAG: HAD family hydrolase [Microbacteriaceae bacterium]
MTVADAARPVLVLDFDGTVCIGDAPVWAYAEAVIAGLLDDASIADRGGDASGALDADIRARLGAFLDGEPGSPTYIDGYAAVAALAADRLTADQLQRAYLTSRRALADGSIPVSTPAGLHGLLSELGGRVERVLLTNAPDDGVRETLTTLSLDEVIDRVVTDAGKPGGWSTLLPELIGDRSPSTVLTIGDIWGNDLAAPLRAGCATALIDRFAHRAGPAHAIARTFEALYPDVRAWAADPKGFVDARPIDLDATAGLGTAIGIGTLSPAAPSTSSTS